MANKKFQEECQKDVQSIANKLNEAIVYHFFEDKFYTESQYKNECKKTVLTHKDEYTDEDWERDKSWDVLEWFYPEK